MTWEYDDTVASALDSVWDLLPFSLEAVMQAGASTPGAFGAAWHSEDGVVSALSTYGEIVGSGKNHAAAEGIEYP